LGSFDNQILSLYAKGMSTRDIVSTFKEMYDADEAVSVVSLTSSSGGYINGRNAANLELFSFGGRLFQQVVGKAMGTNCAPLLADLFLYSYESFQN
jgi:hypothetical protein